MSVVLYTIAGLLLGSVPFAYLLGRLVLHLDIRRYGRDGNPGGANAWRAGGWRIGLAGGFLDYLKGFAPVALAKYASGLSGWSLLPIALAPVVAYVFCPWLHFRGGKAVSTTLGIWTALSGGWGLLAFGLGAGPAWGLLRADAWATVLGFVALLAYLLIFSLQPALLLIWLLDGGLVLWKHRRELREPPRWRFGVDARRAS